MRDEPTLNRVGPHPPLRGPPSIPCARAPRSGTRANNPKGEGRLNGSSCPIPASPWGEAPAERVMRGPIRQDSRIKGGAPGSLRSTRVSRARNIEHARPQRGPLARGMRPYSSVISTLHSENNSKLLTPNSSNFSLGEKKDFLLPTKCAIIIFQNRNAMPCGVPGAGSRAIIER